MESFHKHPHWKGVQTVCETLRQAGFTAWLVGGCVRDGLIGRPPKDFDVVTDALPEQVEGLFEKTVSVGKVFGIIMIPFAEGSHQEGSYQIEVATFRCDGEYIDGRRPKKIKYASPKEDALRRDFTVNGLFYDPVSDKVIDYVQGQADIEKKELRTIGEPVERFKEDRLRLLRAVRFTGELNFHLCPETQKAVTKESAHLKDVSQERIRDEMLKILQSPLRQNSLELLKQTGLLKVIFKEYAKDEVAWSEVLSFFEFSPDNESPELLWSLWLLPWSRTLGEIGFLNKQSYEISEPCRKKIKKQVEALKLSNEQSEKIVYSLTHFDAWFLRSSISKGSLLKIFAQGDRAKVLRKLVQKFLLGRDSLDVELFELEESLTLSGANLEEGTLPLPLADGKWLQTQGIKPGKKMGDLLEELYLLQLEGLIYNLKDAQNYLEQKYLEKNSKKKS